MKIDLKILAAIGAGVAAFLIVRTVAKKATSAAASVIEAVNPASTNNLAYRGVNSIVQAATGQPEQTLGTWIYNKINGDELAKYDQAQREAQSELQRESRRNPFAASVQGLEDQVISPFNVGA